MDDQLLDELRMLRARAYGPDSDIHDDPSAVSRLHDLEGLARGAEAGVEDEAEAGRPAPEQPIDQAEPLATVVDAEPLTSGEPPETDDLEEHPVAVPARPGKWSKKRIVITWLASLAIAVLVTATVTGFVSRRIQADPREIAVLGVDAFAEWPGLFASFSEDGEREPGVAPEGALAFDTFYGLSAYSLQEGVFAYGFDQACLAIMSTTLIDPQATSSGGPIFSSCAAGDFPATVEIVVRENTQEMPRELLEAFPEGTALQFVLDGDEVVVLSDQD